MKYAVIYKAGSEGGYSAWVPDLPGRVAAAETLDDVRILIEEAIDFHIEGMIHHGEPVPAPSSIGK